MKSLIPIVLIACTILIDSCRTTPNNSLTLNCSGAGGPLVIYKTKKDYSNNISVLLSADKKSVLAFPDTKDAAIQRPVALANGFYLQKMVGNAFTSLTFDQYINGTYSEGDLFHDVIDTDPFTNMYDCTRATDCDSLNKLIQNNQLSQCKLIK